MLTACLTTGAVLDLIPDAPSDAVVEEETMRGWDRRHDVDAAFVRDLLLGRVAAVPDPRGLRMRGVRVRGRLDLDLVCSGVPLEIRDSLLEEGLSADQAHFPTLELVGCRIRHPTMIALDLDRVQVDGAMYLNRCRISATTFEGAVRLVDARLGGSLFGKHLVVENADGPALLAHGLRVERDLFLQPGFVADGHSEEGSIAMTDARVGACVWLAGARLRNTAGPAISWDGLETVRDIRLGDGFTAAGAGASGSVRLAGARIGGRVEIGDAVISNSTGPAVVADGMRVARDAVLGPGFLAIGSGIEGTVRLAGAQIGGALDLIGCQVENRSAVQHRWVIDGLTYVGVPRLTQEGNRAAWLDLLANTTPAYSAQPYQQLAAAYRAQGHDSDVRAVLMAQRRDQIARGGLSRGDRWWAHTTGLLLGYGYQPWRALIYLAGILAASVGLTIALGTVGGLASSSGLDAHPCPLIDLVDRGLDLGTPFLPKLTSATCSPTASSPGVALTISNWGK